jgi:hypothetical protein
MSVMSTPRHQAKLNGHYVSSAPEYAPSFFRRIGAVTGGARFWDPQRKSP